jgi:catechol 2,3-dioxygenase-like lactoylglutathione lyase family enzyme
MTLLGIDTVTIFAADLERSVAFFRDCLCLSIRYEEEGWVEFDAGGATLAVSRGGTARPEPKSLEEQTVQVSFRVEDRDEAVRVLRERGVPFSGLADQPFGRIATFEDPDGNRYQIYEPGECRVAEGRTAEDAAGVPGGTLAELDREDIGTK